MKDALTCQLKILARMRCLGLPKNASVVAGNQCILENRPSAK